MPLRRRMVLFAAPFVGAATIGVVLGFSVPALAADPSPSPSASQAPSTTSPAPGQPGSGQQQGNCPNM
jgi:hypothetical protein